MSSSQNNNNNNNIGGSVSTGTTGKRKRDSDNEDGDVNVLSGCGGVGVTPSRFPDAAVSSSTNEPFTVVEIPRDGEFPTFDQLFSILAFLDAYALGSIQHRGDGVIEALNYLQRCLANNEDTQELSSFKHLFASLSGPLRILHLIKLQMNDAKVVTWAAKTAANYFLNMNGNASDLNQLQKAAYESVLHLDGLRILILTVEGLLPSDNEEHWVAARCVWWSIQRILFYMKIERIDEQSLLYVLDAAVDFQFLQSQPTKFLLCRLSIASSMASSAAVILVKHKNDEEVVKIVCDGNIIEEVCDFCQVHCSRWLADEQNVTKTLLLFTVCAFKQIIRSEKLVKAVPLVLKALSKYHARDSVELYCYSFLSKVESTFDHHELEGMPILSTLSGIIESQDASEAVKTKYRRLLRKFTA